MKEEFEQILKELIGEEMSVDFKRSFVENGIDNEIILAILGCKRLDRIADALERISDNLEQAAQSLEVLEQLSEAVQTDRFGTRLYTASTVSGNIQTY